MFEAEPSLPEWSYSGAVATYSIILFLHHVALFLANIWICSWRLSVDIGNHAYLRSSAYTFFWFFSFYRIYNHALFLHFILVSLWDVCHHVFYYLYLESISVIPNQFSSSLTNYEMERGLMVLGLNFFYALFWSLLSFVFLCFFWCVWGDEYFNWVETKLGSPW